MIVAAHQPAYLPWLGYLHKIASCDLFVVMDDLQYEAQNFQNRNRVKLNNGVGWLTVPLARGSQRDRICDKQIAEQPPGKEHWQYRTWRTLETHYRKAPFFARYAEELKDVYTRPWRSLVALDLHLLTLFLRWFGIERPILVASSLELTGEKTERIVSLCQRVGAKAYLSGSGGSVTCLDVSLFEQNGISVLWQMFDHPVYPQSYPQLGFASHLAAIDLLFHCGPRAGAILLGDGGAQEPFSSALAARNDQGNRRAMT